MQQGDVIAERFEIECMVAQGGMGTVYRAFDRAEGQTVAIKLLDTSDEPEHLARFAREVDALAAFTHPRIVRYVSHGVTPDGGPFLAMEWLEGNDLQTALQRGALSPSDALRIVEGAAEALETVHSRGVVHRDLKPSNFFLRGGLPADIVLLDFGIARHVEGIQRLTASGILLGTPHYIAPEQASNAEHIGPAADVFALGCIFHECLTGKPPFDAAHVAGVLAKILFDTPEPVRRSRPAIPKAWSDLILRMLRKDPARRPKDAAALRIELASLPAGPTSIEAVTLPPAHEPAHEEGGEQKLVCVVLASVPPGIARDAARSRTAWLSRMPDGDGSMRAALVRAGFGIEWLADGSLLATVAPGGTATDQARIAARGALYLRERWPDAQIAVATGRVLVRQGVHVGEAVDRAARLLESTREGTPLDAEGVWLDTVTAGLLDARFITAAYENGVLVLGERADVDESRPLLGKPTPCVGRELELAQLEGLVARVVEDTTPQAVIVLAPAGIGKSRLRHELVRRLRDRYAEAEILVGFGDPLTVGSPYVLVGDALRRHAGVHAGDDPAQTREALLSRLCRHVGDTKKKRVGEFLGELCGIPFPADGSPLLKAARSDPRTMSEQITHAFLDWISAECAVHPVVLVLEDLHWGDMLTVKLLESALRECGEAPLFVLALGRPEVTDILPALASERCQEIALRPLGKKASEQLVKEALGDVLGPDTLAHIIKLAQGNALFLEELIRAASEGKTRDVPETVLAMLQARLSRLPTEVRRALRAGSVLGESFWAGSVQTIAEAWGAADDVTPWLAHLVEAGVVERRRESRLPKENEYGFRHALVRDAAYRLLTEADRRAGHLAAGQWLEAMGEADPMVIAGHAREGGDKGRAVVSYMSAAELSFGRNDLKEAFARAALGIACGAEGRALGVLRSIQCLTSYGFTDWATCVSAGRSALGLLPPGSVWWCRAAEKLFMILPGIDVTFFEEVVREIERTEPEPDAGAAYVIALSNLVLGLTFVGARDRARNAIELMERMGRSIFEHDHYARGMARLFRGFFVFMLEPDPYLAVSLLRESVHDLEEVQVLQSLCMALGIEGVTRTLVGDYATGEEVARRGLAIAEQTRESYAIVNATFFLAFSLAEQAEESKLDEAERLAVAVVEAHVSPSIDGSAWMVIALTALMKGDWGRAEAAALSARSLLTGMPILWLKSTACLIDSLVGQSRPAEAVAVARDGSTVLSRFGDGGFADSHFRVAAADALLKAGEREEAESVLGEALRRVELRAGKIHDPALKESFLRRNQYNARTFDLAARIGRQDSGSGSV